MKYTNAVLLTTTLLLAACGGGGGSQDYGAPAAPVANPEPSPPPPAATQTNFTAFMRTQFAEIVTSEAAEPTEVESIDWVFTDDEDEAEYEDVLATSL